MGWTSDMDDECMAGCQNKTDITNVDVCTNCMPGLGCVIATLKPYQIKKRINLDFEKRAQCDRCGKMVCIWVELELCQECINEL